MGIFASAKGGGERQLPPAGTHLARCYSIIDIGTQHDTFQGKPKTARKVRISFELPNEQAVFAEERGKEPFTISKEFTLSLHEKAGLRKTLEAWRGRAFTATELDKFDLANLIGAPAMITINHEKRKDGDGMFAKLIAVATLMKGQQMPPAILDPIEYSVHMGRNEIFEALPDWLKEKIAKCAEWTKPAPAEVGPTPGADTPEEDDVPF